MAEMIGLCVNAAKENYIFANQGTTRDIKSLKEDIKLIEWLVLTTLAVLPHPLNKI